MMMKWLQIMENEILKRARVGREGIGERVEN